MKLSKSHWNLNAMTLFLQFMQNSGNKSLDLNVLLKPQALHVVVFLLGF